MTYGLASADDDYAEVWKHVSEDAISGLVFKTATIKLTTGTSSTTFTFAATIYNGTGSTINLSSANTIWFLVVVNWSNNSSNGLSSGGSGLQFSKVVTASIADEATYTISGMTCTYDAVITADDITAANARLMYGGVIQDMMDATVS